MQLRTMLVCMLVVNGIIGRAVRCDESAGPTIINPTVMKHNMTKR